MRCRSCGQRAGWRRRCRTCRELLAIWQAMRGASMRQILAAWREVGATAEAVERFLDSEHGRGGGTVRDQIAADMANQLLGALGQRPRQDGASVQRLRRRGAWRAYDQRPEE